MKKQWQIRSATVGDAVGLQYCMASAYAAYQDRMGAKRLPPMVFDADHASIATIALHPDFQGQGLGKGMMVF